MSDACEPILIFGTGGISREVAIYIEDMNRIAQRTIFELRGFVEAEEGLVSKMVMGYKVVTHDAGIKRFFQREGVHGLVVPIGTPMKKEAIYRKLLETVPEANYPNIIHPSTTMDWARTKIGIGNIITPGCRLTTNITIGDFNLFNLNSTVGHDCRIGDYCVINPLCSISGGVVLKGSNLLGTGANILENRMIGKGTIIGAGCVVVNEWGDGMTIVGVPGRELVKRMRG